MDLGFLLSIWRKIAKVEKDIVAGLPGGLVELPHIRGIRIFGRKVGLKMVFDLE